MLKPDNIDEATLKQYSPLVLAYIGDAVFELAVRTHIVANGNRKIKDIHHDTVAVVRAESQANFIRQIYSELNEEEQGIVRRGRNAKSTAPRHTDPYNYRLSTGFEALLGYLYLKGDQSRLFYLLSKTLW